MTDKKLLRLDLDAIAARLEQQPSRITNYSRISTKVFDEICSELKKCYYEIDLLREYAKCIECGGQYIGPMDYGLHEWNHSEDCNDKASE